MIIVKLTGGLGNQMFQYALGKHLAILNNTELKFDFADFSNNIHAIPRQYGLGCFNVLEESAGRQEIRGIAWTANRYIRKIINRFNLNFDQQYIKEKDFSFNPDILKLRGSFYLDGYWQSEKYFQDIRKVLVENFTLKDDHNNFKNDLINQINNVDSVSLHIRRGDYINNQETNEYHGVCPLDYYERCVRDLETKIEDPSFFVFSDDISWCKENLKINHPVVFVSNENLKDYEEMMMMSKCQHHIIANSSFSWWGAWLGDYSGKLVYAPEKWFNKDINTKDLIPASWIKM